MIVFLNGKFVKSEDARVSVFDHGFLYGDGVYETLRTYKCKLWQFPLHFKRLKNSAKLLGLKVPYSAFQVRKYVETLIKKNRLREARIRMTLTRGINHFNFETCREPTFCIVVQELIEQPLQVYAKGVKVMTLPFHRLLPEAKTISLLPQIWAKRSAAKKRVYETIYVDHGVVREGSFTNVYIISQGVLITPKTGILPGTTRHAVLEIARKFVKKSPEILKKVVEKDFKIQDLLKADEIFITSAPRGIIPVVKVNERVIGLGKPGKITRQLLEKYHQFTLEKI